MINNVKIIKSNSFDTIKKDGNLTILLIKTYSILYNGGNNVRICERSMLKYYHEILKSGIMRAELKKEIENRICVPAFSGRKEIYTKKGIITINAEHLTDVKALELLKSKILTKDDFKTMPKVKNETKKVIEKVTSTKK